MSQDAITPGHRSSPETLPRGRKRVRTRGQRIRRAVLLSVLVLAIAAAWNGLLAVQPH